MFRAYPSLAAFCLSRLELNSVTLTLNGRLVAPSPLGFLALLWLLNCCDFKYEPTNFRIKFLLTSPNTSVCLSVIEILYFYGLRQFLSLSLVPPALNVIAALFRKALMNFANPLANSCVLENVFFQTHRFSHMHFIIASPSSCLLR